MSRSRPLPKMFLPMNASGVGVANRFLHDLQQISVLAANVDVAALRAHGQRADHDAFDHRVRIVLENQAVFAGAGLALVAVAQHVFRLGRLLGHERPLHPGREPGAAAAAQAGILDLVDDGVRLHGERLLHGLVAVELEIAVDVGRTLAEAPGDDFYLVGMGNEVSHCELRIGNL